MFAVDASTWHRCDAETSPERGFYYSASKHSAGQPIVAGWSYQWITQLDWAPTPGPRRCDAMRIPPTADTINGHHRPSPTTWSDSARRRRRGTRCSSSTPAMTRSPSAPDLPTSAPRYWCRIRDDRVFYHRSRPRPQRRPGRPRRHGARFKLLRTRHWPPPDAALATHDNRYGTVHVKPGPACTPSSDGRGRWNDHDQPPIVRGTVIRVEVEHLPKPTARTAKTLWLWWSGPDTADLDLCWRAYLRRFDIEHTYRFVKHTLGWTTPAVRTPEQADRWTWLVVAAYTQLRLARSLVDDLRLPWQRPRQPGQLTPARVRRGFRRLRSTIGTPAQPPKSRTPGPGRPKGTRRPPRTRYPAVKKAA